VQHTGQWKNVKQQVQVVAKQKVNKKMKMLYFNCGGRRGDNVKKSAAHGKTKPLKLQPYKLTVVQLLLPGP